MSTIFSYKLDLLRVVKIPESRNLNRRTNITWHQSLSKAGKNGLKLICEIQIIYTKTFHYRITEYYFEIF